MSFASFFICFTIWSILRLRKWAFASIGGLIVILGIAFFFLNKYYPSPNTQNVSNPEATPITSVSWREFNSPDGKFKILFPSDFTIVLTNTGGDPPGTVYTAISPERQNSSTYAKVNYSVNVYQNPPNTDPVSSLQDYEKSLSSLVASASGKVLSSTPASFGKYKSLDFTDTIDNGYESVKFIAAGQTVYVLSSSYALHAYYNEAEYTKFINSFTILGQ